MVNYKDGKVYKIYVDGVEECYIGSTTQKLCVRMGEHRRRHMNYKNGGNKDTNSSLLFDKYGMENCKIVLIEDCPCDNKEQLLRREGEIMRLNTIVNSKILNRTKAEYYQDNKEKHNEQSKLNYEENKEHYAKLNKAYVEEHKDEIKEYHKKYYQENKDKHKELQECPICKLNIQINSSMKMHQKTKKCLSFVK